jgi:transcription termination/antitermination protein NusA
MNGEFLEALQQIAKEKDIPLETLVETVESALATAYKRNFATGAEIHGEIRVRIDSSKSANTPFKIFCEKLVVDSVENDYEQISVVEAREHNPDVMAGEVIEIPINPGNFGRIAAQTAKQVMMQRIREAERRKVFDEFNERIGEVMTGVVQRKEGRNVIVNLGKLDALLPVQEQVESEPYRFNDRIKVYVLEVRETNKGAQVVVSRTHPSLIRRLFELEVPEIADGIVSIKSVAREPGARSKIAVTSRDDKVDPVGACVGHRGSRVQAVVNELYDEKIDIVRWNADAGSFIAEALSPAKAVKATVNEESKSAFVVVPDNQLSLAIGKAGQNVRLAARLTGWRIDIRSEAQVARAALMAVTETAAEEETDVELTDRESSEDEETTGIVTPETVGSNGHKSPAEDEDAAQEVTALSGEANATETAEDAESAEAGAL